MSFTSQRAEALAILEKTGIRRSSYEPPWIRLLWRIGVKLPPPHFAHFWLTVLVYGVLFGAIWEALMWLMFWFRQDSSLLAAIVGGLAAGVFFGLYMAVYYAHERHKYSLPSWQSLSNAIRH